MLNNTLELAYTLPNKSFTIVPVLQLPWTLQNKYFSVDVPRMGNTGQPVPSGPIRSRVVCEIGLGPSLRPCPVQPPSTWRQKCSASRAEPASKTGFTAPSPAPLHPVMHNDRNSTKTKRQCEFKGVSRSKSGLTCPRACSSSSKHI